MAGGVAWGAGSTHLCLGDAVDDGLQRLMAVTLEDSLHAAGPRRQRLAHRHGELVVVLLGRQVLQEEEETQSHQQVAPWTLSALQKLNSLTL